MVYLLVVGLPFAVLAALLVLARRAESGMFRSIEGQPGAALAALKYIRKGWDFAEEPVAMDPRTQDMVFRGVGRAGIVLVGEGPPRVARLLEGERKKVARVLPNVPVHLIQAGNEEGQVPLKKLPRHVQRLRSTLTKTETAEVTKRLKALGRHADAGTQGDRPDASPPRPQGPQGPLTARTHGARAARSGLSAARSPSMRPRRAARAPRRPTPRRGSPGRAARCAPRPRAAPAGPAPARDARPC